MARKRTHDEFVEQMRKVHGDKYQVLSRFTGYSIPVKVGCGVCQHRWLVTPNNFAQGRGCPNCQKAKVSKSKMMTKDDFKVSLKKKHQGRYTLVGEYAGSKGEKLKFLDSKCGKTFYAVKRSILYNGSGCPHCNHPSRSSKVALDWLRYEAKTRGIRIRHAENWGEVVLPGTRFRVDGFHKPTNTVFEFYGDYYHGNPKRFKPADVCHPYNRKTAGELLKKTLEREKTIKELGYNLVTMWESDFREAAKCQ